LTRRVYTQASAIPRPEVASLIRLEGVTKDYPIGEGHVRALDGVDLEIGKGEILAVMGPSGSGKSTLLNMMGCIDRPTSGSVHFDGADVSALPDGELTRLRLKRVGFVFQQFYLIPTLKAAENVELPMREAKVPRAERQERAAKLLGDLGLSKRLEHYPSQLSGGEQQRVAIARALANKPEVILGDEPTGELDSHTAEEILGLLSELNRAGITVVLVTHDPRVAAYGKRTVDILDGRVVSDRRHG
jgi:putative ABC transport system ATP-binding protein